MNADALRRCARELVIVLLRSRSEHLRDEAIYILATYFKLRVIQGGEG